MAEELAKIHAIPAERVPSWAASERATSSATHE